MPVTVGKNLLKQNERKKTMRKRMLKKRLSELELANLDKTSEIAILRKEKIYLENRNNNLKNQLRKFLFLMNDKSEDEIKMNEDYKLLYEENEKLLEKVLNLQADKEGLIEYAKELRYMHSCAEDEIKRLNDICDMLNNNIEAQNVTAAQNDIEFYKLVEQNAFLAGEVKAYQAALPKAEIVISEE